MEIDSHTRPFRYAADPVCVAAAALYVLNRFLLKPHDVGGAFTACYVNDVLCLPLFVPLSLYAQRFLRLRPHDGPPRGWEVAQHAIVFSVVFELFIPRFTNTFRSTADPWDVLAYLAGGAVAWVVWSRGLSFHRLRENEVATSIAAAAQATVLGSGTVAK